MTEQSNIARLLNAAMTRSEARIALHKAGWIYCGGGSFSSVWRLGQRVIKVTKPDGGARLTYEAAQALPFNSALPRYFDKLELVDGGTAYEVEALAEFDEFYDEAKGEAFLWLRDKARCDGEELGEHEEPDNVDDVREAYDWLHARFAGNGLDWDVHAGNVMFRGDALVLIDVVYECAAMRHSAWSGGTAHNGAHVAHLAAA